MFSQTIYHNQYIFIRTCLWQMKRYGKEYAIMTGLLSTSESIYSGHLFKKQLGTNNCQVFYDNCEQKLNSYNSEISNICSVLWPGSERERERYRYSLFVCLYVPATELYPQQTYSGGRSIYDHFHQSCYLPRDKLQQRGSLFTSASIGVLCKEKCCIQTSSKYQTTEYG